MRGYPRRSGVTVFGADYAAAYDDVYSEKDYASECDLIERLLSAHGSVVRTVLDLGCGTGNHASRLAERGYEVVGVDRSPDMLVRARQRSARARFELGDVRTVELNQTFDAVLIMFAVLGYQVSNPDALSTLATARRHVRPGGLLFADLWYGPAVLAQRPSERVKVIDAQDGAQLIRVASAALDLYRNACTVAYRLWRIERGLVRAEVREEHVMRYFFSPELELLLSCAGFELVRLGAFPNFEAEPTEQTWNVALLARAT
jgi:SAM-dependent methyltransferase